MIVCPAALTAQTDAGDCTYAYAPTLTAATATDNCSAFGALSITYRVMGPDNSISTPQANGTSYNFVVGISQVEYTVIDAAGNVSTCVQQVTITEDELPVITCPTIAPSYANTIGECGYVVNGTEFDATATDNCTGVTVTHNYGAWGDENSLAGATFPVGTTTVTWTATDAAGNVTSCTITILVNDTEAPSFVNCPEDVTFTVGLFSDDCESGAIWATPIATDNCGVTVTQTGGPAQDSILAVGLYEIEYTATDDAGNAVTCTFNINVIDTEDPVIVCPGNVVINNTDANTCMWTSPLSSLTPLLANSNCDYTITWSVTNPDMTTVSGTTDVSGYVFAQGVSTVTYTITETASGQNWSCSFTVTVVDTEAPVIVCPADLTIECGGVSNGDLIQDWIDSATATDNCLGEVVIEAIEFFRNSQCGVTETILYRFEATDISGNTSECYAEVVIEDTTPPVISGGSDMDMEECTDRPSGNYPEFDFWLTNHAGSTAEDACGQVSWSNNYDPGNWVEQCGNTRYVDVTFYAMDVCGNVDSIRQRFAIGDHTAPAFTNCPRPPVIVDAPAGWCSSFVNYSPVTATDNCSSVTINQIDDTGLSSGSLFPVGLTILIFEAVDECGNRDTCELKIVVNDYHTPPTLSCPADTVVFNVMGQCSALVNNIAPVNIDDNCPDNLAVTYEVRNEFNEIVHFGIEDVSGHAFEVGENTVTYKVSDQPILLITEIVQDGNVSGIEIGNFGPASFDISCLHIQRESSGIIETFDVPNGTVVNVGGVYTYNFTNIPQGQTATYSIEFLNRIIDQIFINSGSLIGYNFYRISPVDTDSQNDFKMADLCHLGSFGDWNPQLPIYMDNGTITSLQSEDPSMDECSFVVTVMDIESPMCAMHDTMTYVKGDIELIQNTCISSTVTVGTGIVGSVSIENLMITIGDAGALHAYLTSPSGTQIKLLGDLCENTSDIDVTLTDLAPNNIFNASCDPLGNGSMYKPLQAFKTFFGEQTAGDWTLEVYLDSNTAGSIDNWELVILSLSTYVQPDVTISNDAGLCSAEFVWTHPVFNDNCCEGEMTVTYNFENTVTGMTNTVTETILSTNGVINLDGTQSIRSFDVGVTTIIYTLTDQYGNESECSFVLTVEDNEVPEFPFGCQDINVTLGPGECFYSLSSTPILSDNCGIESFQFCNEDGIAIDIQQLPIGNNVVVLKVTDIYGNVGSCTFMVSVFEHNSTSNTLACNGNINLSLDANCEAVINADMVLEGGDYRCYDNYCIEIMDDAGQPHDNLFTIEDVGETFVVRICDCLNSNNCCWGNVTIDLKLIPDILCPEDVTLACNEDALARYPEGHPLERQLMTGEAELLSCVDNPRITFTDYFENHGTCSDPRATLVRRWKVSGNNGVEAVCDQTITFDGFEIENVKYPEDYILQTALSCSEVAENPGLTHPDNTGYPTLNDRPIFGKHYCDINVGYNDQILQDANCPSSYQILRYWIIADECAPLILGVNPIIHIQSIKVDDREAPILEQLNDVTISADPLSCTGTLVLPENVFFDECSMASIKWSVPYGDVTEGMISQLPKGETMVSAKVTDMCGNVTRGSFMVTVIDDISPVPVIKQNIVVSLTVDADGKGTGKLFANQFDNGSYDNCSDVALEIRRKDGIDCGNIGTDGRHNNNVTFGHSPNDAVNQRWSHPEDTMGNNVIDNDGGEYVMFCCEDIPAGEEFGLHEVELRVWDDGNMNGIIGDNDIIGGMRDNYNTSWAMVRVENKLPPQLVCPGDVTLTCDMELNYASDWTDVSTVDLSMTGIPVAYDLCTNLLIEYRDQFSGNDVCNIGTVRRTFRVTKGTETVTCHQDIELIGVPSVFGVVFPQNNGKTEWDDCALTLEDVRNTSDVRIKRPIVNSSACDIVGESIKIDTFVAENGVCKTWRVEYNYINWCTEERRGPFVHFYEFKDEVAPVLRCNNQEFAADPNAQNPSGSCEGLVRLEASATDSLICTDESWVSWQMYMDGWNNGTVDRLGSSFVNKSWFGIWVSIPRYMSGGLNPSWVALQEQHPGVVLEDLLYVTYIRPTTASGGGVSLPSFTMEAENISHKVTWKITDGCGNVDVCESTVKVVDKKSPTPYCVGISTALMRGTPSLVEVWARDFDQGSFDNCSVQSKLYFTFDGVSPVISRLDEEHFYKSGPDNTSVLATVSEYNSGGAYKWNPSMRTGGKVYRQSGRVNVRVDVWDEMWNVDYCTVDLEIRQVSLRQLSGTVKTFTDNAIREATVVVDMDVDEYPKVLQTDETGRYQVEILDSLPYKIRVMKDTDYLNGVSTLDLVYIQRHILGTEEFGEDYQWIAADVNNDGRVTASDLTELRKLILGITRELPENESWRFVVENTPIVKDPRLIYEEESEGEPNFRGVKIGDVNSSAITDLGGMVIEGRTEGEVLLSVDEMEMIGGEVLEIPVYGEQFEDVTGFQMTWNVRGLRIDGVIAGVLDMSASNISKQRGGGMVMSYSSHEVLTSKPEEVLFTIIVRVEEKGKLSDMLSITSEVLEAESYDKGLKVGKIRLTERVSSGGEFELYQNEPNPYKSRTQISFKVPEAGKCMLTVRDVSGQVILRKEMICETGMNTVELTGEELGTSGVLFYTLTSGDQTATRKMIIVE